MSPPIAALLAGFVIFVVYKAIKPNWPVRIDVSPGCVPQIKGVAQNRHGQIEDFCCNNLRLQSPITIWADKERSGRLHIKIAGELDRGTKQRIRNFLCDLL